MATTQELIDLIDGQLETLINNIGATVDYREGDVEVKNSQKVKNLLEMKELLLKHPDAEVTRMTFDFNVTEFGVDEADYED